MAKFSCKLICLSIKILSGIDRAETVKRYSYLWTFYHDEFEAKTILRPQFLLFSVNSGLMGLNPCRQHSSPSVVRMGRDFNKIFSTLCEGILPLHSDSGGDSEG